LQGTAEYKWTSPDNKVTISRAPHMRAKALVKIDGLFEATFFPRIESRIQVRTEAFTMRFASLNSLCQGNLQLVVGVSSATSHDKLCLDSSGVSSCIFSVF
jgi:hypothetical protein